MSIYLVLNPGWEQPLVPKLNGQSGFMDTAQEWPTLGWVFFQVFSGLLKVIVWP